MIAYLLPLAVSIAVTLPAAQVESAPVLFARGMQALQAGQLPEAERCFVQVTKQDPASAAAFVNLGVVFMREKRWPEALRALKEAESMSPDLPGIHLNLGLVYYRSGDFGKAVPEFRLAHGAQAEYLLGLSCFFSDQYGCATEALEPLWESHTSDLTYLYVLGSAAGRSKQESLETKAFEQMAVAGGDTPLFHLYKGKALIGKQVYGEAVSELQIASGAKPPLPMSHYYLAEAYQGEHNEEAARSELLEEIRLEPEVAYSYDQLGHVCELLGAWRGGGEGLSLGGCAGSFLEHVLYGSSCSLQVAEAI